jgi:serine/threonine protein kinase
MDVVLTWIEGIPLDKYLENIRKERRPWLDPGQAVRLIHGLANAVCQLNHGKQIAHGDIQPANIIVTSHPSRLVLIDFGSAWVVQDTAGRQEGDGVNRCYAAPELSLNVSLRQACVNHFERSGIVGCQLTMRWRATDEYRTYTRPSGAAGGRSAAVRALAAIA